MKISICLMVLCMLYLRSIHGQDADSELDAADDGPSSMDRSLEALVAPEERWGDYNCRMAKQRMNSKCNRRNNPNYNMAVCLAAQSEKSMACS